MRNYFFNALISAIVCFAVGILGFLVGRDGGPTAGAMLAGSATGVVGALAYMFGGFMNEDDGKFNGTRLIVMLAAGILAGLFGGFIIGVG